MSDSGDHPKYKWTPESTSLLVSVWSDRQVQKQLEYATKPQIIWESVARYMKKKGYNVTSKQCRSRMKQVLVCYREAKRAGTRAGVEQYYESIDRVLKDKRLDHINDINGIDTVDAAINIKSPAKEVKTNKNLQMRHKYQEPVQSLYRTEALSPTWTIGRDTEYPDSPESNETIIARPYGVLSPTRDVGINTMNHLVQQGSKPSLQNSMPMEEPIRDDYKQNFVLQYPYPELLYQNSVQNVQNHIIQENMQQNQHVQNRVWSQTQQQNVPTNIPSNYGFRQNSNNVNPGLRIPVTSNLVQDNVITLQNPNAENILRQQNQLQQNMINNRAMPQEPSKIIFGRNLAATCKRYSMPQWTQTADSNQNESPDYSPDVSQNLNDAFCQSTNSEMKAHNLNETFNQHTVPENQVLPNVDASVITNNATCNDDSLLLEFIMDSPTPSENETKSKDSGVNTDIIPNVPFRKKKAQKLEQLVLSAISSQNEVVNKILAAQNDMVTKFLDIDRDRQNRLENRLDHLLNVVHASVLPKNSEAEPEIPPPPPEPIITSLVPPPKPGAVPPKLDLVPPKPCRVPCTMANSNVQLVNQNPVLTRPGVVSPITSPTKKPGTIWSKLGPVSQSPFVKAQQRLGFQTISNSDARTQSSAERKIAREVENVNSNVQTLIYETAKFLEVEKHVEEKVENARLENNIGESLTARRRLFTQREPTPAMILTAAFLEAECKAAEGIKDNYEVLRSNKFNVRRAEDDLLAGQGESYERLRQLDIKSNKYLPDPCDTSTPAKCLINQKNIENKSVDPPKQTIQQLAQLVMNSARWRDAALQHLQQQHLNQPSTSTQWKNENVPNVEYNPAFSRASAPSVQVGNGQYEKDKAFNGINNQIINNNQPKPLSYNQPPPKPHFPIGFTTTMLNNKPKERTAGFNEGIGLVENALPDRRQQNVHFMDDALAELQRMYAERTNEDQQRKNQDPIFVSSNGGVIIAQNKMIERYVQDILPKKQSRDKDTDSDDEEFLDTTGTMPPAIISRRGSLTSSGTGSTDAAHSTKSNRHDSNCVLS